jgi:hypothetical protein
MLSLRKGMLSLRKGMLSLRKGMLAPKHLQEMVRTGFLWGVFRSIDTSSR